MVAEVASAMRTSPMPALTVSNPSGKPLASVASIKRPPFPLPVRPTASPPFCRDEAPVKQSRGPVDALHPLQHAEERPTNALLHAFRLPALQSAMSGGVVAVFRR